MKRLLALTVIFVLVSSPAFAAAVKTYQVTGPVTQLTDDLITVKKGKDLWEIARTPDTKVTGDLKVGSKVTVEYRMTTTKVEVKETTKPPAKKK
jgi:opacity protein-like surface antigen